MLKNVSHLEEMGLSTTIELVYVRLLNEGTIVYRPTKGEKIDNLVFRILPTDDYDPNEEEWEFTPGTIVLCIETMKNDQIIIIANEVYISG